MSNISLLVTVLVLIMVLAASALLWNRYKAVEGTVLPPLVCENTPRQQCFATDDCGGDGWGPRPVKTGCTESRAWCCACVDENQCYQEGDVLVEVQFTVKGVRQTAVFKNGKLVRGHPDMQRYWDEGIPKNAKLGIWYNPEYLNIPSTSPQTRPLQGFPVNCTSSVQFSNGTLKEPDRPCVPRDSVLGSYGFVEVLPSQPITEIAEEAGVTLPPPAAEAIIPLTIVIDATYPVRGEDDHFQREVARLQVDATSKVIT